MEALMTTIKTTYKLALTIGYTRVEARQLVIDSLKDMGIKVNITDEILNG